MKLLLFLNLFYGVLELHTNSSILSKHFHALLQRNWFSRQSFEANRVYTLFLLNKEWSRRREAAFPWFILFKEITQWSGQQSPGYCHWVTDPTTSIFINNFSKHYLLPQKYYSYLIFGYKIKMFFKICFFNIPTIL